MESLTATKSMDIIYLYVYKLSTIINAHLRSLSSVTSLAISWFEKSATHPQGSLHSKTIVANMKLVMIVYSDTPTPLYFIRPRLYLTCHLGLGSSGCQVTYTNYINISYTIRKNIIFLGYITLVLQKLPGCILV